MGDFTGVCLGFPTVLFTGALVVVAGFWVLVLVGGADAHGPGHHGHGGGSHGETGLLAGAGLGGAPATVVCSLLIALAWFLSLAGSSALDGTGPHGPARTALSFAVLAAALVGCWLLTWLLVRPLRRLFPYELPPSREDFVGRLCVIRTGAVTGRFGRAEVVAPDGSTAVVQVRQTGEETFASGGTALLYAYEPKGEFFWVASFEDPAAGPPGRAGT